MEFQERLDWSTKQCYGLTSSKNQCRNRQFARENVVWCHHHVFQGWAKNDKPRAKKDKPIKFPKKEKNLFIHSSAHVAIEQEEVVKVVDEFLHQFFLSTLHVVDQNLFQALNEALSLINIVYHFS